MSPQATAAWLALDPGKRVDLRRKDWCAGYDARSSSKETVDRCISLVDAAPGTCFTCCVTSQETIRRGFPEYFVTAEEEA